MGFFKKKEMDQTRVAENKAKMRALFDQVVADKDGYEIVYGFSQDVKTSNYILASKTTYTYTSLIIGYRVSDQSIILIQTTPDLEGCSDPIRYTMADLKKVKIVQGQYCLYHQGGLMAGYTSFCILDRCDEDFFVYVDQSAECDQWCNFWEGFKRS